MSDAPRKPPGRPQDGARVHAQANAQHRAAGTVSVLLREAARAIGAREHERAHALCMQVLREAGHPPGAPHAEALLLLAGVASDHGNFAKADEIITRALGIPGLAAPLRVRLLAASAQARSAQREHDAALARAREALAALPDQGLAASAGHADTARAEPARAASAQADALACDTLGVVFARAGEHAAALPLFARAVRAAPGNASYHYNLATALQFTGDLTGAEQAYRQTLALAPSRHAAYTALAQLCPADDEPLLAAITQAFAAAEQAEDADACLLLGHALATLQERRRDVQAAMHTLQRAKSRKRVLVGHRPAADAELFAAATATLHALPSGTAAGAPQDAAPLFVFGLPRSGTTLVERILASHPQVRGAGELGDFSAATKAIARTPGPAVLDVATLLAAAGADMAALGRDYLARTQRQRSGAAHVHGAVPATGPAAAAQHFVDKMPLNLFYAALVHRALPNARMVCLRRHPMDVCLGNYRQLFGTRFSYYNYAFDLEHTAHYVVQFERYLRALRAALPEDRLRVLDYDALVADQEAHTRHLLDFCGLPWDPACLDFHRNHAAVSTASSVQVRQPLYQGASGRWRRYGEWLQPARRVFEAAGIELG